MSTEAPRPDALQQDLAQARDIQEGLLRQVDDVPAAVEVEAFCEPATAVGGDFYDTIALSEGRVAVVVGDVSGHGIAAAMLAVMLLACAGCRGTWESRDYAAGRSNHCSKQAASSMVRSRSAVVVISPPRISAAAFNAT